jgi:hypothetical protein
VERILHSRSIATISLGRKIKGKHSTQSRASKRVLGQTTKGGKGEMQEEKQKCVKRCCRGAKKGRASQTKREKRLAKGRDASDSSNFTSARV